MIQPLAVIILHRNIQLLFFQKTCNKKMVLLLIV